MTQYTSAPDMAGPIPTPWDTAALEFSYEVRISEQANGNFKQALRRGRPSTYYPISTNQLLKIRHMGLYISCVLTWRASYVSDGGVWTPYIHMYLRAVARALQHL